MPVSELELFQDRARSDWVRLRTLVTLRWIAIGGQIAAVLVAVEFFRLQIEVGLVVLAYWLDSNQAKPCLFKPR